MSWILLLTRKIESLRTCREEKTPAYTFSYVLFPEMFSVCTDLLTYISRSFCDNVSYFGIDPWPLVPELWPLLSFKVVGLLWFLNAITFSIRGPRITCQVWPLTSQSWFDLVNYCAPLHATGVASSSVGAAARRALRWLDSGWGQQCDELSFAMATGHVFPDLSQTNRTTLIKLLSYGQKNWVRTLYQILKKIVELGQKKSVWGIEIKKKHVMNFTADA